MATADPTQVTRDKILQEYRKKLLSHKDVESRLKEGKLANLFKYPPNFLLIL